MVRKPPLWLIAVGAFVAMWLVLPVLIVIPLSFTGADSFQFPPNSWSLDYYVNFFTDRRWREAFVSSLILAVVVAIVATFLGTLAAFGIVRGDFPGKSLVNGFLLTPIIAPGIVIAVAVFGVFLSWRLTGSFLGFVLAHGMLAIPFVVVTVSTSLRGFDRNLERAAASLGAGKLTTFRRITLPAILPGVLTGALFAFVTSFDEVVVALYLQSPTFRTLPVKMYTSVANETDPTIAAASTIILVITTALILLPQLLRRNSNV